MLDKKNIILLMLVLLFAYYGCNTQTNDLIGNPPGVDNNQYLITINGDLSSLSQNQIDAEYSTFLFIPNESRKIYLGGRLPTNHNKYNAEWIENSSIWNPRQVEGIFSTDINNNNYYGIPITPGSLPPQSGDYNVYARVGLESGGTYTPYSTKNLTFKVSPNYDDRDWGLRVYQQQSYNVLNLTKDEIVNAFNDMNVYLAPNGNNNIINISSNLPDETLTYDFNRNFPDQDPCVVYAFDKIYPGENTSNALVHYFNDHPNEGLIFFVKNYNPINIPINPKYPDGYTLSNTSTNGVVKVAPISFIFVQRLRDLAASDWETKVIQNTTIHELGHLWCEGFTDNETHSLWHNGNNLHNCAMKSDLVYNNTVPDNDAQKVLNFRRFCEGHLQRGMNVSWQLKQYSPFGQGTSSSNKLLLASNNNFNYSQNGDLEIEIYSDKTEYLQGEFINIVEKIKNNTNENINLGQPKHYLYDIDRDSMITSVYGNGSVEILANSQNNFFINPLGAVNYKDIGVIPSYPWFYWYPGNYEYYLSQFIDGKEYRSNKIKIKINPVPDSLLEEFNTLKSNDEKISIEKSRMLLNKYKGSYYEKEFYYKLLTDFGYFDKINEANSQLYEEFIIKYPDNDFSYKILNYLSNYYEKNKALVNHIIERLKTKSPNSKLLIVLKNQPDYMNKQIKHLLK